jgi:hypothetical protein
VDKLLYIRCILFFRSFPSSFSLSRFSFVIASQFQASARNNLAIVMLLMDKNANLDLLDNDKKLASDLATDDRVRAQLGLSLTRPVRACTLFLVFLPFLLDIFAEGFKRENTLLWISIGVPFGNGCEYCHISGYCSSFYFYIDC